MKKRIFIPVVVFLTVLLSMNVFAAFDTYLDNHSPVNKCFLFEQSAPCIAYEKTAKISKLKSSNTDVATVNTGKINGCDQNYILLFTTGKVGSTIISFKLKNRGETKSYSFKYIFKKYTNPFKSFKIGSKNFTNKYNKNFYYEYDREINGKLSFSLKNGWKISNIFLTSNKKSTPIKKGAFIKYNKNKTVYVELKDKSGFDLSIRFGYLN